MGHTVHPDARRFVELRASAWCPLVGRGLEEERRRLVATCLEYLNPRHRETLPIPRIYVTAEDSWLQGTRIVCRHQMVAYQGTREIQRVADPLTTTFATEYKGARIKRKEPRWTRNYFYSNYWRSSDKGCASRGCSFYIQRVTRVNMKNVRTGIASCDGPMVRNRRYRGTHRGSRTPVKVSRADFNFCRTTRITVAIQSNHAGGWSFG